MTGRGRRVNGSLVVLLAVLAAVAVTEPALFANWAGVGICAGAVWAVRSAVRSKG